MKKTDPHTQTDHHLLKGKAHTGINEAAALKTSVVLRELLFAHKLRPYDLSKALNMPNQTIHQLLHKPALLSRMATLLPIAKFFNITISQLIGEKPLGSEQKSEDEELAPGVWNSELFMQCTQCVVKLLEKYNTTPNEKLAAKLICTIYAFSLRRTQSALDEVFADWHVSQYAGGNKK